ncbi:MAG: tetratricopeptide repeat protein [Proteobacteria bacterium]|nr:tetratricopeptide repeat protein [Pseudomonadota bacterium]
MSVATNRPLTLAQAARFEEAIALLRKREVSRALGVARDLVAAAPGSADALHLQAMCLADAGDVPAAEASFRGALALAPGAEAVGLNFASWLGRCGRIEEAIGVLQDLPASGQVLIQRGSLALRRHDPRAAREAFEAALRLQPDSRPAWLGLGNALRTSAEPEAAEHAFRRAIGLSPGQASAWVGLGVVLRQLGRLDEALACLREAQRLGYPGAELLDEINGTLQDAGRPEEALAGARSLVDRFPAYASGHASLAHLLWEHGPVLATGEDPFAGFLRAARAQPANRDLQLRLAGMLVSAGRAEEAVAALEVVHASLGEDPVVRWFLADAHDRQRRFDLAGRLYAQAFPHLSKDSPEFLNAYARHAFRAGDPDLARRCASLALKLDPDNQEAWSHLGTCWRLADDPREEWLFGYDRLIGDVEVDVPTGFADLGQFLGRLDARLASLHLAGQAPVNQSVQAGSQTSGRLFGRDDALIRAAELSLKRAVERWAATLPDDPGHPFLSRKRPQSRFVGSWSVRLRSSGRHSNHIHNEGWMSSAFYVSLPASVGDPSAVGHPGWIQFGQPLEDLGLALAPRRLLRPRVGHVALFPSYMWHGTLPFSDVEPRLTIAFDVQPT